MGVIGWTEQQTLDTTIPAIELAYKGRSRFIADVAGAIFGGGGTDEAAAPTPDDFRAVFRLAAG